jgi:hypothetical protein
MNKKILKVLHIFAVLLWAAGSITLVIYDVIGLFECILLTLILISILSFDYE